jgi:hypothetical protein
MEINIMLIIFIAIMMMILYQFLNLLVQAVSSGVWDYGNLAATFLYALIVGFVTGYTGMLDLSMPFEQWLPVLMGVWAQYLTYLFVMHAVFDYIIAKIFPVSAPQGLATPFLTERGKQTFSLRRG